MRFDSGISPAVGVILLIGITAAVATLAGIVLLDIGSPSQSAQAGVETTDTPDGVEVSWNQSGSAERIKVLVDGQEVATLTEVSESVTIGASEDSTISVIGVRDDGEQVISETETEYDTGDGTVEEYNAETETVSGSVSINPPIPNATVKSISNETVLDTVTTDSSGQFTINAKSNSKLQVIVTEFEYDGNPELYASDEVDISDTSESVSFKFNSSNARDTSVNGNSIWVINGEGEAGSKTIGSVEQLQSMTSDSSSDYKLVSDIDASPTSSWNSGSGFEPIDPGSGDFNGNNYTISELYIDRGSELQVGLFEGTSGSVRNLTLENPNITGQENVGGVAGLIAGDDTTVQNVSVSGGTISSTENGLQVSTGGIAGTYDGTDLSNISSSATVNGKDFTGGLFGRITKDDDVTIQFQDSSFSGTVTGGENVGGLLGRNSGARLSNTYMTGDVTGDVKVGGLVGAAYRNTTDSYSAGSVTANTENVGGLIGFLENGHVTSSYSESSVEGPNTVGGLVGTAVDQGDLIQNSYSTGPVTSTGDVVGGLVGSTGVAEIKQSYSTSTIDPQGNDRVGGLVGSLYGEGSIVESYANTEIVSGESNIGGLVGVTRDSSSISKSYATGSISSVNSSGGLVGFHRGGDITNSYSKVNVSASQSAGGAISVVFSTATIENVYAVGTVSSEGTAGGFMADSFTLGDLRNTYWDTESTGQSSTSEGSTGLTTSELQGENASENLTGFDFTDTWTTTDEYPELRSNRESP